MLHIVFLILKIIGIILAVILGILILLIGIVLFVPVRYEAAGKSSGDIKSLKGKITITWLLHLVRVDILYKNRKLKWRVRFAWLKRGSGQTKEDIRYESKVKEEYEEIPKATPEVPEIEEKILETRKKSREEDSFSEGPRTDGKERESASEKRRGISEKIQRILEKIKIFFEKIKYTFQKMCDKIKVLSEKKDKVLEFLQDETHVTAFKKTKKEMFALLKRLNPKKLELNVRYGFEDPYRTGQVLAGLSILYPFIGENANIIPDFERQILKGDVYMRGKLHGYYFLILCWNLFWSKQVRTTYKHIRNFEL